MRHIEMKTQSGLPTHVAKKRKTSHLMEVLGCMIGLVLTLTLVVSYDISAKVINPHNPFHFTKQALDLWSHDAAQNTTKPGKFMATPAAGPSLLPLRLSPLEAIFTTPSSIKVTQETVFSSSYSSAETNTSLAATRKALQAHPLLSILASSPHAGIDDVLVEMQRFDKCTNKPLVITMAKIGTPLYWQLVENFVFSMAKFDLVECALMVCIADQHCMDLCAEAAFPCFLYDDHSGDVSAFQKIAHLKLHALPLASARGVDIFMVDLDVGFRRSPLLLVESFMRDPTQDVLVQKDVSFVMNRTTAGWRTWFTKPVVNIGLFAFKGNSRVQYMFDRAWRVYQKHSERLDQPGTDQSIIQDCLHKSHDSKKVKLSWGFFPDSQVVLVDKIHKFESQNIELGGEEAESILTSTLYRRDAIAVHATCYEMKVKVPALKAVGAFWNPGYYDPWRRTLTTKLYFRNSRQLRTHLNALAWLALATNRSLIVPNLMADEALRGSTYRRLNVTAQGHVLWPGWRVMKLLDDKFPLTVVEPGYYWRVERDYVSDKSEIPAPFILSTFETAAPRLLLLLQQLQHEPRVVLNVMARPEISSPAMQRAIEDSLRLGAGHSVGLFSNYSHESSYSPALVPAQSPVPGLLFNGQPVLVESVVRACSKILLPPRGNRSCFDKCK